MSDGRERTFDELLEDVVGVLDDAYDYLKTAMSLAPDALRAHSINGCRDSVTGLKKIIEAAMTDD